MEAAAGKVLGALHGGLGPGLKDFLGDLKAGGSAAGSCHVSRVMI